MVTPVRALTEAAMSSHLDLVRLASVMWEKISALIAILWTATEPTPPAPITSTLLILDSPAAKQAFAPSSPDRDEGGVSIWGARALTTFDVSL